MQKNKDGNDMFFALDIGTRSVIGLLGEKDGDNILIKHVAMELHKKRAMYDGQVHDIQAVADIAQIVRTKLEEASGTKLTNVAIAAAGRSLKTIQNTVVKELPPETLINSKIMKEIEIQCLQEASDKLKESSTDNISYYNVGHTVMTYKLDDYEIKNPSGHHGKKLSLEVIATFLPKIVVEALDSVMQKINLSISYMTLEPIVAIEVAIPENVRLLNIAMVDIGAGTSDIAITKDGTIVGYAMTSTAGDEITEALSQKFLLDFDSAEELKCNLFQEEKQKFTDIVGMSVEMTSKEILDEIQESISLVANNISDAILKANGKSPSAVFLIGGGSQIPGLTKIIAENLGLQENRVAIKNINTITNILNNSQFLEGPQSITPVGILACAIKNERKDFMNIKVNEKDVKLFRSNDLKISDALILAGFNPRDLISRKGKSMILNINDTKKMFSGTYGNEANIYINNEKANIDTKIDDGDDIKIESATPGTDANLSLKDIINPDFIHINGDVVPNICNLKVNGIETDDFNKKLENGDSINYEILDSIEKLKIFLNIDDSKDILINNEVTKYDLSIYPNDVILIKDKEIERVKDIKEDESHILKVFCNNTALTINTTKKSPIFVDIFDHIDFDRTKPQGNIVLKLNDKKAEFTSPIKNGDKLEVYWEK